MSQINDVTLHMNESHSGIRDDGYNILAPHMHLAPNMQNYKSLLQKKPTKETQLCVTYE